MAELNKCAAEFARYGFFFTANHRYVMILPRHVKAKSRHNGPVNPADFFSMRSIFLNVAEQSKHG